MSISIVYFSHTGNNEALAQRLAERLSCGLTPITEKRRRSSLTTILDVAFGRLPRIEPVDKPLEEYEHLILIAPVWAGALASPLRSFLQRERGRLRAYSFITLCGYDNRGQRERLTEELTRRAGRAPQAVCELPVSELFPVEKRTDIRTITPHRVRPRELDRYADAIEDFLKAAGLRSLLEERTCHS